MTDHYAYWKAALAGEKPEIHADHPQCGIYKARRFKNGPLQPVTIWYDKQGVQRASYGDESVDPLKVWTHCGNKPVSKADYLHWREHGRFPGEIAEAGPGHNSGDLSLFEEIADAVRAANEWLSKTKITDKVTADTAANMATRLAGLSSKAEKEREEKVAPHLKAQREINGEYKPVVESAAGAAKTLKKAWEAWGRAEEARIAEEQRRAAEAERAAWREENVMLTPPPAPPPPPKVQGGGQAGRRIGMKDHVRFEIENYDVLIAEFCEHEDVRALVLKLATQRARTGVVVPGLKRIEERIAV
jgi:hypothetical protein